MSTLREISEARASKILVAAIFALVVTACVAFLGLQVSHDYTASIGLIGTIDRAAGQPDSTSPSHELPAVAQAALTDDAIADIDSRVHPYSALASKLFPTWSRARLRSELGVENIYSGTTIGAVALVFTGNNRETALKVTSAAADLLTKPHDEQPHDRLQTQSPPPPPAEAAQPEANETPAPQAEARAPAVPPPAEGVADSIQLKAIRELRLQLAALAQSGQDLETQISTKTDSVTAIEQEKEHIRESVLVALPAPKPIPVPPDPKRAALQSKLAAYAKVLATLRDRYTEDYPDVINARERVEELQVEMARLPRPPAPAVERREQPRPASDVPQRLLVLDERERPLEADLEQMRSKLKSNEAKAASLRRLLITMPAKTDAQSASPLAPAPVSAAVQPKVEPMPVLATKSDSVVPIKSRFSVATPAEIRGTEQVFSPEAIATVSVLCGLATGFLYLALGAGRTTRKPREEAEPEQAAV